MRIHNFSLAPPRGLVNVLIHLELDLTPPAAGFEDHRVLARTRFGASPALVCRLRRDALLQVRRHAWQRELASSRARRAQARERRSWAEWFARAGANRREAADGTGPDAAARRAGPEPASSARRVRGAARRAPSVSA